MLEFTMDASPVHRNSEPQIEQPGDTLTSTADTPEIAATTDSDSEKDYSTEASLTSAHFLDAETGTVLQTDCPITLMDSISMAPTIDGKAYQDAEDGASPIQPLRDELDEGGLSSGHGHNPRRFKTRVVTGLQNLRGFLILLSIALVHLHMNFFVLSISLDAAANSMYRSLAHCPPIIPAPPSSEPIDRLMTHQQWLRNLTRTDFPRIEHETLAECNARAERVTKHLMENVPRNDTMYNDKLCAWIDLMCAKRYVPAPVARSSWEVVRMELGVFVEKMKGGLGRMVQAVGDYVKDKAMTVQKNRRRVKKAAKQVAQNVTESTRRAITRSAKNTTTVAVMNGNSTLYTPPVISYGINITANHTGTSKVVNNTPKPAHPPPTFPFGLHINVSNLTVPDLSRQMLKTDLTRTIIAAFPYLNNIHWILFFGRQIILVLLVLCSTVTMSQWPSISLLDIPGDVCAFIRLSFLSKCDSVLDVLAKIALVDCMMLGINALRMNFPDAVGGAWWAPALWLVLGLPWAYGVVAMIFKKTVRDCGRLAFGVKPAAGELSGEESGDVFVDSVSGDGDSEIVEEDSEDEVFSETSEESQGEWEMLG